MPSRLNAGRKLSRSAVRQQLPPVARHRPGGCHRCSPPPWKAPRLRVMPPAEAIQRLKGEGRAKKQKPVTRRQAKRERKTRRRQAVKPRVDKVKAGKVDTGAGTKNGVRLTDFFAGNRVAVSDQFMKAILVKILDTDSRRAYTCASAVRRAAEAAFTRTGLCGTSPLLRCG